MFVDFTNIDCKIQLNDELWCERTKKYERITNIKKQTFDPVNSTITITCDTKNNNFVDHNVDLTSDTVRFNYTDKPVVTAICKSCGKTETATFNNFEDNLYILKAIDRKMKFVTSEEFNALFDIYTNHNKANASIMVLMHLLHTKNVLQYCEICSYKEPKIK